MFLIYDKEKELKLWQVETAGCLVGSPVISCVISTPLASSDNKHKYQLTQGMVL